jgi:hypothetical protein
MSDALAHLGTAAIGYAWATHILLALITQVIAALILRRAGVRNAWWIGAALAIGFYWGRKKMEYEFTLQIAAHLHSHAGFWYRGRLPFEWPLAWQIQFYAPAAAALLVAYLIERPGTA